MKHLEFFVVDSDSTGQVKIVNGVLVASGKIKTTLTEMISVYSRQVSNVTLSGFMDWCSYLTRLVVKPVS